MKTPVIVSNWLRVARRQGPFTLFGFVANLCYAAFMAYATVGMTRTFIIGSAFNSADATTILGVLQKVSLVGSAAVLILGGLCFAVNYTIIEALTANKPRAKRTAIVFTFLTALGILCGSAFCAFAILHPKGYQALINNF